MRRGLHILALTLILFLVACGEDIDTNMSRDVSDFSFTTQDNETLSSDDLKGKWWIADFIFTNCTTVCLPMTANMSKLQERMKDENLDAHLISFSVDPEYDTPEVLTDYAENYQADLDNWTFLTGYDFQTIKDLSIKSFQSALAEPPAGSDQVMHGTRFFLVNPEGKVIKNYNGIQAESVEEIITDLQTVLK
ncbi:protein SCO1/2 [Gracilibacillus halotolerans]|uniref:Protein SCO1/2 n=1 Tax=Gracilibacillus halotolerans TaxID=74386 RepID=A0A841RNU5_9BACI|nr:SCO family protein [Gracilibacillus halotolerans]MBB6512338.1 protein SCO1/2 [Gracilibacillus halotolerans]